MLKKLQKVNESLTYYVVEPVSKAIGEDGGYLNGKGDAIVGYGARNKETGVVEHTTIMLPSAIFQADYLDKALTSMLDPPEKIAEEVVDVIPGEDPLIN